MHRDSHLEFGKRLYSVPWRFIGKQRPAVGEYLADRIVDGAVNRELDDTFCLVARRRPSGQRRSSRATTS